jgi:AcrR family transcriptional regulator
MGRTVVPVNADVVDGNIAARLRSRAAGRVFSMSQAKGRYHHGDLRRAFLDHAAKLVEEEGVSVLTLRELARRVGVSHAASTNHFADKATLLGELAADGFEELSVELAGGKRPRSPESALREMGRAYVRFALRRPGHFRVMFGQDAAARASSTRLATASTQAYEVLEQAVVAVMPPARARSSERVWESAFFAWSVVHGAATLMLDSAHALDEQADADAAVIDFALAAVVRVIAGDAGNGKPKRK